MIEPGLADAELGKLILAACFITGVGTMPALRILFADFSPLLLVFGVVTLATIGVVARHLGGKRSPRYF